MQFQLGERDIEIERMKTTLIALNEKLVVTNDIKSQLDEFTESFSKSEAKRGELQVHMVTTSKTIEVLAGENTDKQESQTKQINSLMDEI